MDTKAPPNPAPDATLTELADLGMRAARVVVHMMEIEQAAADIVAAWLPEPGRPVTSLSEAQAAGLGVDTVTTAMAEAVPRIETLARALDRLSRAVRRSVALMRQMQAGWPRARSDNRAAMLRRQVGRSVAAVIRREAEGEAAERLFDDLAERLDDPAFADEVLVLPPEEVVRRICRDLGLATASLRAMHPEQPRPERPQPPEGRWPADTG